MRAWFVVLAACGGSRAVPDVPAGEAGPVTPSDAFVLPPCESPVSGTAITIRKHLELGAENPVLVTAPPEDPRLFVVDRGGLIRIVDDGTLATTPFLDVSDRITAGDESGLLGLAFHPRYRETGRLFISYTRPELTDDLFNRRNVIARCEVSPDPGVADPASCVEILAIRDLRANHNGGMIEFGPDGLLYIGTGDGGGAGDPHGNAQTLTDFMPTSRSIALQGKLLRIDVDREDGDRRYAIPPDNPFLDTGAPEVYALGLRNPWRWTFDRATGDLWLGDVGQNTIEEIDFVPAGQLAGANFGWDRWEGSSCFTAPCTTDDLVFPINERLHAAPDRYTAIIGGEVYRGTCFPDLVGTYFYGDNQGGQFATITFANGTPIVTDLAPITGDLFPVGVSSIHGDARGELWVTTLAANNRPGAIHRIEVRP